MDKLGRFEGLKDPDPKENIRTTKENLKATLEKYKKEGLEIFAKNLPWKVENDIYAALSAMINNITYPSEAESFQSVFNEAENKLLEEKNRER